jgi:hypothetical protein
VAASNGPEPPPVPDVLGEAGAALWGAMTGPGGFVFSAHELRLLREACATVDVLELLERQVAADGPMIEGSKRQDVLHPAVAEGRAQRLTLARLLATLDLPDEDAVPSPMQLRGRRAAEARWSSRGA